MRTSQKLSMKEQILRKSLFVFFSFTCGIISTVVAAAVYDANVQSRANTIFNSIQSVAGTLDESDVPSYYSLVRMNIASLVQVLRLVDTKIVAELGLTGATNSCLVTYPTGISSVNANFTIGTPTSSEQAWQNTSSSTACYYSCKTGFSGAQCTATGGSTNSCASRPSYLTETNTNFSTGTATSVNQAWVQNTANCGYTCKTGYSGTNCNATGSSGTGASCAKSLVYKDLVEICDTGKTDTWTNLHYQGGANTAFVGNTICPTGFRLMYWSDDLSKIMKIGIFDFSTGSLTLPEYHLNGIISYQSEYCSNSTPSSCSTPNTAHAHSFKFVNGKYIIVPDYTTTQWGGTSIKGALCIKGSAGTIKTCEISKSQDKSVRLNNANSFSGKYVTDKTLILADDSLALDTVVSDITGNYTYTLTLACSTNGAISQSEAIKRINSCASGYTNIDNKCVPNAATLALREYGCETKKGYVARPNLPLNDLPGYSYVWNSPTVTLSGGVMLYVCDSDSMLNNAGSTEYAFDDIKKACPTSFHPMERWELDLLGGTPLSQLGETTRINNINKTNVTHWMGDNALDNESSFGYIQYSPDLETPSSDALHVRCVQNNGVGRDGKTDLQLAGCSTIRKDTTSGIEYCASTSKLKADYSKGLQVSGGKQSTYSPYKSAAVTFPGNVTCPTGFDFPSETTLFSKIPGLSIGAKTYEYGKYKVSLTRIANNQYAIRDESEGGDNVWKTYTGRSMYDYLNTGYVQDNDLLKLSGMVSRDMSSSSDEEGDGTIGGVCIKKTAAFDAYIFKLTGCNTVKKIGTVDICEKESEIGKCSTGYHVINYAEYSANKNTFFQTQQSCSSICWYSNPPVTPFKSTYTWSASTTYFQGTAIPSSPETEGYKVINMPQTERFAKKLVHNGSVTGDDTGYIFSPRGTKVVCIKD